MGKSLLACFITNAIALANKGKEVWLIDTDPQGTILQWAKTSDGLPKPFRVLSQKEFDKEEKAKGFTMPDFIVIDTQRELGQFDPKLKQDLLEQSDMILVPMVLTAGTKEYKAMIKAVEEIKARSNDSESFISDWRVVANKVKTSDRDLFQERKLYANLHGCQVLESYVDDNEAMQVLFDKGFLPQFEKATQILDTFNAIWEESQEPFKDEV